MFSQSLKPSCATLAAAFAIGLSISGAALAQNTDAASGNAPAAPAEAPKLPPPNPDAEKALHKHFQSLFSALEGKAAVPDAKNFSEDFNKQVSTDQIKQVFAQVHQTMGKCRIAGQLKGPVSFVSSYLLQCDNGFVPMDISVEETAPYKVQSLLIRPGYAKL
ncbi:hypothetical protein [Comamonas sp. NoAH]|uniref:hypothetical protein n=1 Tax=Comamonas halotolerans TaxID=3041496 RepID=UPI0024E15945|nr:hypothetical protein [Comamonas sp. NoAH]